MRATAGPHQLSRASLALLVGLSLVWGLNWPVMKTVLIDVPPLTFRALCTIAGGLGLLGLAWAGGFSIRVPRREWRAVALGTLFNIIGWNVAIIYGLSLIDSSRAVIIAYTMPLWGTLFGAIMLGERVTSVRLAGLVAGMAGMAVLLGGDLAAVRAAPWGALLAALAALCWALGTVLIKRARLTTPIVVTTAWQLLVGAVPITVAALALEPNLWRPVGFWPAAGVVYNMALAFTFCYWAWFRLVAVLPVAVVGMSTLAIPVIGVFSSAVLLGEPAGLQEIGALVLVVIALAAVLMPAAPAPGVSRPEVVTRS